MPDQLLERVRALLRGRGLLRPDALLLVAVSGGPDSLCLLHLLRRLRADGGPALHVAHLDHGARGAESAAEAAAVAALAAAWGLPATVGRRDVPALAAGRGEGLMAAARRARYAFLATSAAGLGAAAVAVAHQADDQAETVLMHLLRGAGPAGLRGMRDAVPWAEWAPAGAPGGEGPLLVRPLLTTARGEIASYCRAHGLDPAEDPSNSADRFARVRARRLIRALAAENPRVVEALGRAARVLGDDYAFIQAQLDAAWPGLAVEVPGAVVLRRAAWEALHPALRRYAIRRAAAGLGQPELSMEQVEAALTVAARPGRRVRLGPGLLLSADQLAVAVVADGGGAAPRGAALAPPAAPLWPAGGPPPQLPAGALPLPVPGSVELGDGWRVVATDVAPGPGPAGPAQIALDPDALGGPLVLRGRRPGDRFRPAGGRGSRKLQDFFVDQRVPRGLRDAWPILATPAAVVWVVGLRADGRFVAAAQSQSTIWVTLSRHQDE